MMKTWNNTDKSKYKPQTTEIQYQATSKENRAYKCYSFWFPAQTQYVFDKAENGSGLQLGPIVLSTRYIFGVTLVELVMET